MLFKADDEGESIEIDLCSRTMKGKCKAKNLAKQMQKVKEVIEGR